MKEKLEFVCTRRCDQDGDKVVSLGKRREQKFFWVDGKSGCKKCVLKDGEWKCRAKGFLFKKNGGRII